MHDLTMPKVSMGDDEIVVIVQWSVEEGETFEEGDVLLAVETSKATMEIEANESGRLIEYVRRPGDELCAGEVIALVAPVDEPVHEDAARRRIEELASQVTAAKSTKTSEESAKASHPSEIGAGASSTTASEPPAVATPSTVVATWGSSDESLPEYSGVSADYVEGGALFGLPLHKRAAARTFNVGHTPPALMEPQRHPVSKHRRALARLMTESNAVPQFSVHRDIPMTQVLRTVEILRQRDVSITLTDVMLRIVARTLLRHSEFNANFVDESIYLFPLPAIALATDSPAGVVAPIVRGAESLSWEALAAERRRVVEGARGGYLLPRDMSGGTFAFSNVGALGADLVIPMLMPPQVAILGLGRVRQGWGENVATAVVAGDHRVLDGAAAARFLASLAEFAQVVDTIDLAVGVGANGAN